MSHNTHITCLTFSLVFGSLLFCPSAHSQTKAAAEPSPYNFDAADQLFKQNTKILGPDFVALVWKDGKVVYQKQGGTDFTAKTPAPIAGAGNWMTAALVMTFVDEGKLSLDDKVTQYIPLFGKYMKGYITIRNCLTNTTGIRPDAEGVMKVLQKSKFETLEDEVNNYAAKHDIVTNPGTEFVYSPIGPNIAARVLEVISKKGFDRLMSERILRPLKMRGTSFSNEDGGAVNPAGGARSTANDYISFLSMLLNKGVFGDKRILSEKAVEELEKVQFASLPVKAAPKDLQGARYTLGAYTTDPSAASPSVLFSPNILGTTAFLDKCRNYAAILIVAKPEEEKKIFFQSLKSLIDGQIGGSGCQ
ncbi:MAG TPA: serine hydrolase domain-containing protein [Puia sp.]|jgi:CubicO group peptidase (beta-lactamase class C family)